MAEAAKAEAAEAIKQRYVAVTAKAQELKDSFTNSERFQKMVHSTFEAMDMDKSGQLSELEVYCGVLMLYTKIVAYCPTAVPPSKEVVDEMVKDLDANNSGSIDEEEFKVMATVLCKNVASRVAVEMLFAFLVGPVVASMVLYIVDAFVPPILSSVVPAALADVFTKMRTTITVAIVLAAVVPKLLAQIDRAFDVPDKDKEK